MLNNNSKIYKSLVKDINKIKDNNYIKNELNKIKEKIDNLYSVYSDKITDDDIKIIIANTYLIKLRELSSKKELDYSIDEIKILEEEINIYEKYFKNIEEAKNYYDKDEYSFASIYDANRVLKHITKKNSFAIFLNTTATILLLIGFIHAVVNTVQNYEFVYFITTMFNYIIISIILYALAGIFNILHDIFIFLPTLR